MSKDKIESRNHLIKFRCTAHQKRQIISHAKTAGAASVSQYLLTLALEGDTAEYGFFRRRARKPLELAAVYQRLGFVVALLQSNSDIPKGIELIQEIRQGITIGQ